MGVEGCQTFSECDSNPSDGVISSEELQQKCPKLGGKSGVSVLEIIAAFDKNKDGNINEPEFKAYDEAFATGVSTCFGSLLETSEGSFEEALKEVPKEAP